MPLSSFASNLSGIQLGRTVPDTDQQPAFSRIYNSIAGDYIPLRSSESSNADQAWFALSRWERLLGFSACLLGAAVCFFVAFLTLPFLALNPAKFALSFSLGSLLVMFGFAILIGPVNHFVHMISKERLPFTLIYLSSLGLTLYFSMGAKSYFGSLLAGAVQVVSLVVYVLAYFPGGMDTLRFGGRIALQGAGNLLPLN